MSKDTGENMFVEQLKRNCLAPENLELKIGAQVATPTTPPPRSSAPLKIGGRVATASPKLRFQLQEPGAHRVPFGSLGLPGRSRVSLSLSLSPADTLARDTLSLF